MVSQRSTPKRSPRRRRVHESSRTDSLSTKGDVDGGSGRTSTTSAITWKYFAEESDMPPQRIKPIRTPIQQEFEVIRNDDMAPIAPQAPEPKILTLDFDPVVVHTTALLRYRRMLAEPGITAARIGPVPECATSKPALLSSAMDASEQISEQTAELVLRKAIELLCAHAGFLEVDSRAVNLLARLTASKLTEFGRNCKISNVRRIRGQETAFTSPMMHVLQLAGIPRLSILREFYVNRVRERRDQLLAICQRGRAALLKPAERRTLSKKRPTRRDDGSRSDSDDDTTALTPKRKRERTTTTTTTVTTTTTGTDKDTPSELNFLED